MADDAHSTAQARRRIAIEALGRELSNDPTSASTRLGSMLGEARPMVVSADIDGLVSATMLGSVAPNFEIAALSVGSAAWLVHPSVSSGAPSDMFGVDVFSANHDNVSNHVIKWGDKKAQLLPVREAFARWDLLVDTMSKSKLLAVPALWANTQGGREQAGRPDSSTYKYPFGTAQILLAMLEASGHAPKFFDRTYLPWLVANCDGGVSTYARYAANARVWWPVMAGAIGPGSLTEQIFELVDTSRPHDFLDAVHRLDRERPASVPQFLNDKWNLMGGTTPSLTVLQHTLTWLTDLTGWRDPVRGGIPALDQWVMLPPSASGLVYYTSAGPKGGVAKDDPLLAASLIDGAASALNANFYQGGMTGSRFNWVGSW
ncbi:hypothetical protein ACFQW6_13685 [Nocardioides sp. GCM10028917]|uniref:hypothetical protein n=1 Tax=Nocardioides sp. GCM10028917 TaxID=3273408 RepID=UPI00360CAF71